MIEPKIEEKLWKEGSLEERPIDSFGYFGTLPRSEFGLRSWQEQRKLCLSQFQIIEGSEELGERVYTEFGSKNIMGGLEKRKLQKFETIFAND